MPRQSKQPNRKALEKELARIKEAVEAGTMDMAYAGRVLTTQATTRARYPDYDAIEALAIEEANRDPQVKAAILASPNPAEMAYQIGQRLAGSPVASFMPAPPGSIAVGATLPFRVVGLGGPPPSDAGVARFSAADGIYETYQGRTVRVDPPEPEAPLKPPEGARILDLD